MRRIPAALLAIVGAIAVGGMALQRHEPINALWILAAAVLGGCVQDMIILLLSTRRDGRSLGQMARDELGPLGGFAALIGTLIIMIILSAVLGLVIVNVMKHSPWATSTVFATIPAALIVGLYLRLWRP